MLYDPKFAGDGGDLALAEGGAHEEVSAAPGQLPHPTDRSHLTPSKSACGGRHQAPGTAGQGLLQPWGINIREEVSNTEPVLLFEM